MAVMPLIPKQQISMGSNILGRAPAVRDIDVVSQDTFRFSIAQERKRTDRSGKMFLLLLLSRRAGEEQPSGMLVDKVLAAISFATRETDTVGWYEEGAVIGVIFTEIIGKSDKAVQSIITKVTAALSQSLEPQELDEVSVTCHLYPEQTGNPQDADQVKVFYPKAPEEHRPDATGQIIKRGIDIVGSSAAILFLFPIFLAIAALIKLTSKGPVLFRQNRVGQFGQGFTFLKFRSMYVDSDSKIHKDYVTSFIAGNGAPRQAVENGGVYKITNDPRITPIGRFIRRTSLDELPQFFNVLRGDMSLVGPRPPLPYEFECYGVWHRRRVFEVKPGITGLWQVNGRSRTTFDDMVRLDLQYVRTWSLWLDIKILLKTPWAVVNGSGAY